MNPRVSWDQLPAILRSRIEGACDTFVKEEHISTGHNCLVGMILHAGLAPGSADLPEITATLQVLSQIPAPGDVALRKIEDRWREFIGGRAALLAGSAVAHTGRPVDRYRLPRPSAHPGWPPPQRRRAMVPGTARLLRGRR